MRFQPFDPAYINGKIDYYESDRLEARLDLGICDAAEMDDFALKVQNTNGVSFNDFRHLSCIPSDKFKLSNEAASPH